MKRYFSCSLRGRDWWQTFLSCMIAALFALIPLELALMNLDSPHKNPLRALTITGCIVFGICFALAVLFGAVRFFRRLASTISLGEKKLAFTSGKAGIAAGFSGHFEFAGERIRFARGGAVLFGYIMLGLIIPQTLTAAVFFILGSKIESLENGAKPNPAMLTSLTALHAAVFVLFFFAAIPFICLVFRWIIEIKTKDGQARFEGSIASACGWVALQTILSILTIGIYWPLQVIRTWKYFLDRTTWKSIALKGTEPVPLARAGFDGSIKKGFALLWTQSLLCAITLGLYFPWAFARIADYLFGHTFVETK